MIVLVWALVYVTSLFQPPLLDDADTVHAEAAREMVQTNDWVTLHINNGFRYLEKAPLIYWATAISFKLFGVHDWSARLPVALGVLALLLVVYRLGRRVYGEEGGFYAALVLATGFGPFIFTRIMIPDMLVGLWLALGFDFFLSTLEQEKPSRWLCWGIAATMALNVLTKGLAGFRNPAQGEARGFFWFYFVNEHFLRFLKKRFPADYDTIRLDLFWGLMLVWLMPWTAFIVQAIGRVPYRIKQWRAGLTPEQRGTLLFVLWMLSVLVFFSFSSRQEYYVIPGVPGLALMLGGWLARETTSPLESRERRTGRISSLVLVVIGVAACVAAVTLAVQSHTPPVNYDIAELLKKNPQDYALSFGHFLDLTPQAMGAFRVPLLVTGIAFALGTILNWLLRRSNRTLPANLVLATMMIVLLHEAHAGLKIFSPVLSSKVLADKIQDVWKSGDVIEINGDYEAASSINFYTHERMRILNGRRNNIWYGSTFPDAPTIFDDDQSFNRLWHSGQTIFLWTEEDSIPDYVKTSPYCQVAKWGGKLVLTNERTLCPAQRP